MIPGNSPVVILKEGTKRDSGRRATHNNIAAAKAIAEAVRSTLGPKGMDKMLVDSMGDVVITNDGVTILKEVEVEHPAAKMVVEIAKTQDSECGDGTTTAVILAGELLKNAEELLEKGVHPTAISNGYRKASQESLRLLEKISRPISKNDTSTLKAIAITSMTGKSSEANADFLADLTVRAVKMVSEGSGKQIIVDRDNIKIQKKHGVSISDTELVSGIIMDKEPVHTGMPTQVSKAKVALIDAPLEIKKTEIESKIQINDPSQIQAFLDQEEASIKKMVDQINKTKANVLICQKGIDDLAQHYLAKYGIMAIRRAKKSDIEALAKATGGRVVSNLEAISKDDLGFAGLVEVRKVGDDDMTFVTDCKNPKAVSILVRGGSEHVVDEIERNLDDAIGVVSLVVKDGKIVTGGGYNDSVGYFIEPTTIVCEDPRYESMAEEIFGPVLSVHVYPDNDFEKILEICDSTSEYALTGSIFAKDRRHIETAMAALRYSSGNFYINDKPTGAVVGQQPFGGARGSGTNDKAGSPLNLLRWVSPRSIKETFAPPHDWTYGFHSEP